ncbi:TnsA endonuclease N-terminal domain-containing protein [Pseudomonas grandcourensis]|uniref:TnsA endonuclease N-terminal domain-containing protein n=1 Tax=Pseudomonas grandcourensis TaxID=3136736 RepID=UPI00326393D3
MKRSFESEAVARDVSRRVKRGNRCHVFSSVKNPGQTIAAESFLERDIGFLIELDPRILRFLEQPFTLELNTGQELPSRKAFVPRPGITPCFYTPDFLCQLADGVRVVIEVKSTALLDKELDKLRRAKDVLESLGYRFTILTENDLNPQLLSNIQYLKCVSAPYLQDELPSVLDTLSTAATERECWTAKDLARTTRMGSFGIAIAVFHGIFHADLNHDLFAPDTQLFASLGDLSHLQVLPL